MSLIFRHLCTAAIAGASLASAVPAIAAPGIYTWVFSTSDSQATCMRKARDIGYSMRHMTVVEDPISILMQARTENYSYNIRCDITGRVLIIVAGALSTPQIARHTEDLKRDYQSRR